MKISQEEALLQIGKWLKESESEIHLAIRGNEQPECPVVVPMRNVIFDYSDDRELARFFKLPKERSYSSCLEISSPSGDRFILAELEKTTI